MSAKVRNIFSSFTLVHGSHFDKGQSKYVNKLPGSAGPQLLNNNNNDDENDDDGSTVNEHLTSSNIGVLLEELDRRTLTVASLDCKVTSNKVKEQLKRHLRSCDGRSDYVPWHLYGDADLWTALKSHLRHLPTCPLGSNFYQEWSRVQWDYSDSDRLESIRMLLKMLSHSNRLLVRNLFRILHKMSAYPLMETSNSSTLELAAKLGPYLVWDFGDAPRHSSSKRVHFQTLWLVAYIIDHFKEIFAA